MGNETMILQFILQVFPPAVFLSMLLRSHFNNKLDWLLQLLVLGSFLLFSFVTARWDWFSYYLRILLVPLFGIASYIAYRKITPTSTSSTKSGKWTGLALNGTLLLVATWFNVAALRGYFYSGDAIHLASPLRTGLYYVGGGGSSHWLNGHQADGASGNDFALDIVRLNVLGNPANVLEPSDLTAYAIYGDTVHSPCTGTVRNAVDGVPDQTPPQRNNASPAGNHIVISCQGAKVLIAHMMNGSLTVKSGDPVSEGQVIGRVGNSGSTSQPHLHIHAAKGGSPTGILDGEGIPILLDDKFLTRNSLFRGT